MAEGADPVPQGGGRLLAEDLEGAMLLLSYAAQAGLDIDEPTARTIARSRELHGRDKLAGDDVAGFYLAYRKLSAAAAPVTVPGLRAATGTFARGGMNWLSHGELPESKKAVGWYWRWTLLWLFVLVAVQIYWVIGSIAMDSVQKWQEERKKVHHELNVLKEKLAKAAKDNPDFKRLTETQGNLQNRIAAYADILETWNSVWNNVWRTWQSIVRFVTRSEQPAGGMPGSGEAGASSGTLECSRCQEEEDAKGTRTLAHTRFILFAFQAYVLPLLYGLLGACTYVLRMLSRDVRSYSYTPDSHVRYKIRLVLGTLSGLAITWFFEPGSETLKSLSPLALAFLAGYSVEILFAAMDRFVAAFSTVGGADGAQGKAAVAK